MEKLKTKSFNKKIKKTTTKNMSKKIEKSDQGPRLVGLNADVWPIERDVFFRPARLKYVRKLMKKEGCVFCYHDESKTKDKGQENLCVYKSKYSQIVINKFPYNSGHLLILPLRHCGDCQWPSRRGPDRRGLAETSGDARVQTCPSIARRGRISRGGSGETGIGARSIG